MTVSFERIRRVVAALATAASKERVTRRNGRAVRAVLAVLMIASDDNTRDVAAGREDLPAMLPHRALMSPDQR